MITYEIYLNVIAMPGAVRSFVRENPDGSYNIFVNECLSESAREQRLIHELKHIYHNDFREGNVDEIENDRHRS